ncbi:MAG: zinc ribbon domain-containing protein [Clostridia bacterium]|nr:zinc ribbon domain-containing protein [Clostridia bacterium]
MKINCRYCGELVSSSDERCPSCGAVNTDYIRTATGQPTTIRELEDWYRARKLPPYETTRFFIGQNQSDPRCFGIYQDANGDFVVYKNKADGSRAVRYSGKDEKFAVNEFYQRLKSEIVNQKEMNARRKTNSNTGKSRRKKKSLDSIIEYVVGFLFLLISLGTGALLVGHMLGYNILGNSKQYTSAYYRYEDNFYYYSKPNGWLVYDEDDRDWNRIYKLDKGFLNNYEDYTSSLQDFENAFDDPYTAFDWLRDHPEIYSNSNDDSNSNSYSWDNDYDWDSSDSWDSGDTDWDSDW